MSKQQNTHVANCTRPAAPIERRARDEAPSCLTIMEIDEEEAIIWDEIVARRAIK